MAELLESIDHKIYRSNNTIEGRKKVLYAQLAKVLYRNLGGLLLFWQGSPQTNRMGF